MIMIINDQIKINVHTESKYRDLAKLLNNTKIEWYFYENRPDF